MNRSWWRPIKRILLRHKLGMIGLLILIIYLFAALFPSFLAPYDPRAPITSGREDVLAPPGPEHLLGLDELGKDVLSLVIYGARTSITVGVAAALIIVIIGSTIGLIAGYYGGSIDNTLMRVTNFILVIPAIPLMIVVIAVAGRELINIIIIIGLLYWAATARLVRSEVLSIRERTYIMRAKAIGASSSNIILKHILPQVIPLIFAQAILSISFAIAAEATLSFLGVGDSTAISWGGMLNHAFLQGAVTRKAWWYIITPGFALVLLTISLAFVGTTIEMIVNPRLKKHHLFNEKKIVAIKNILRSSELDHSNNDISCGSNY